jgi:methylenetetrahydrofolate reductase (NADPH)
MKIIDIINGNKPSLSFEVFPPKTTDKYEIVYTAVKEIALLNPSYMSVTYGAGGGTSEFTSKIAKEVQSYGITPLAHLSCISSTKKQVYSELEKLKSLGINNILALRGDIPKDFDRNNLEFHYAYELIDEIKKHGDFCIGGACYPECHPESLSIQKDFEYLKIKVEHGCDFLTTQMFFDNNLLYNFLYKIREAGINVPVVAGIMPITNAKQVERAVKLSGSFMPQRFKALVDKFGSDDAAMKQAGIAYATDQIIDLFANNITNVHVYSMNKPDVAEKIQQNLSDMIGK